MYKYIFAILVLFTQVDASINQAKYEVSLAYTKWTAANTWWTKIEPYPIYLGALPLKNEGHLEKIIELGVTSVLSMVEDFEMEDGWWNSPVKGRDWEINNIYFKHIQAVDFTPLKRGEIEEGVEYLAKEVNEGHTVYVHCKAGRGRSASIVIAYLIKHQGLSFEEAFNLVKEQRPQINLNKEQTAAILAFFDQATLDKPISADIYEFFQSMNDMSEAKLEELLHDMLYYVVHGGAYAPSYLSTLVPSIEVQSTVQRRDRYLSEFKGDPVAATEAAIARNHSIFRKCKIMATNAIPFIGMPTSQSISLWHQLREIALIAAINGHDVNDPQVQLKILSCLVGGELMRVPSLTLKMIAKELTVKMAANMGLSSALPLTIPVQIMFNYFTSNSEKVSTHAKLLFAGDNA